MNTAPEPAEVLAVVDAVLRLATEVAELDDLVPALAGVVDVAVEGASTSLHIVGRDAPLPPFGGEPHRALVAAAVARAASTGERAVLTLPGGSWPTAWVAPAVTDTGECVAVFVVWRTGPGVPGPADNDVLDRGTRLATIVLAGNDQAAAARRAELVDSLTGLANRRQLETALADLDADPERSPCAAIVLDVDGFGRLNADHGEQAADHVLVIVGERLRGALRARDLVCRWGGDEFVVLCRDVDSEAELAQVSTRLQRVVSQPMAVDEVSLTVTVSDTVLFAPLGQSALGLLDRIRQAP